MTGEHDKERRRAILQVAPHGWWVKGTNPKNGYTTMHCSCGFHQMRLPKTSSNMYTFRRKAEHMIRLCSTERQA